MAAVFRRPQTDPIRKYEERLCFALAAISRAQRRGVQGERSFSQCGARRLPSGGRPKGWRRRCAIRRPGSRAHWPKRSQHRQDLAVQCRADARLQPRALARPFEGGDPLGARPCGKPETSPARNERGGDVTACRTPALRRLRAALACARHVLALDVLPQGVGLIFDCEKGVLQDQTDHCPRGWHLECSLSNVCREGGRLARDQPVNN